MTEVFKERMAEIRGEKVVFNKSDYVPLHEFPSAQVEEPLIVNTPPPRTILKGLVRFFSIVASVAVLSVGALVAAIETGAVDEFLSSQAQAVLTRSLDDRFTANIGSSSIRFMNNMKLAIVANNVVITDQETGLRFAQVGDIGMELDPLSLFIGRISVVRLDATGMLFDTVALPQGDGIDLRQLKINTLPTHIDQAFKALDTLSSTLERINTETIRVEDLSILLPAIEGGPYQPIKIGDLTLQKTEAEGFSLNGNVSFNNVDALIDLDVLVSDAKVTSANLRLDGFDIGPLVRKYDKQGNIYQGLEANIGVNFRATRGLDAAYPDVEVILGLGNGKFYMGSEEQFVTGGTIRAVYDHTDSQIRVVDSVLTFGATKLPITGFVEDGVNGLEFSARIEKATTSAATVNEPPVEFNIKADGSFNQVSKELSIPQLFVTSPQGTMAGSLKVRFSDKSPEISFGAQLPQIDASAAKQLWPFWMARKARPWVIDNLIGGVIRNGSIAVFIPEGRMCGPGCPLELSASELQIKFDIDNTRLNVTGEIPPLRDLNGRFDMTGEKIDVTVSSAASFFQSNRILYLTDSDFSIADVYEKPLMANIDLNAHGTADTVAELATFKPINALSKTEFKVDDFSGLVKAEVDLRIGLLNSQNPPAPFWIAKLDLDKVSLKNGFQGRSVKDVVGKLDIGTDSLHLTGKGTFDDVQGQIEFVEPLGKESTVKKKLDLSATLSASNIAKLAPGLSGIVGGSASFNLSLGPANQQDVKLDLTKSTLVLPGVGWSKGAGIPATATFSLKEDKNKIEISNFVLKGDGFGAAGRLTLNGGKLVSANFSRVQLSAMDNYSVALTATRNGYDIVASGSIIDLRLLLGKVKESGDTTASSDDSNINIKANFDKVVGFNDEYLTNIDGQFSLRQGKLQNINMNALSASRQAIVAQTTRNNSNSVVTLTSSDAGSLARFTDLYTRLRGGLLNIRMNTNTGASWSGSVDLRNFSVVNESKLQDIVAKPVGQDGRSLNSAVKRNIDVSSERFQRAFARVVSVNGAVALENGVIRGEQIGATFQGLVRDRNGNIDLTGTFMPAYGLNRIFGELPIVGAILGNGTDRGLLGITFKMTGKTASPTLKINPLSIIAPGIFRQIFEFQ